MCNSSSGTALRGSESGALSFFKSSFFLKHAIDYLAGVKKMERGWVKLEFEESLVYRSHTGQ
jgi:hypothetical protein